MSDILVWPPLLTPNECKAYVNPFTRSGGRTLGGIKPSVRTDLGHWRVEYVGIPMHSPAQRRVFEMIDTELGGTSGRIAIPVWSMDSAPYASGQEEPLSELPFTDGSMFSDGTTMQQSGISVVSVGATAIGATTIAMRVITGAPDLSGVRFSYNHALYKTGRVISVADEVFTLRITPSVRQLIPAGSQLEFDRPTCICNLQDDAGMQRSINSDRFERVNVSFVEDTDYWNRVALGLI